MLKAQGIGYPPVFGYRETTKNISYQKYSSNSVATAQLAAGYRFCFAPCCHYAAISNVASDRQRYWSLNVPFCQTAPPYY